MSVVVYVMARVEAQHGPGNGNTTTRRSCCRKQESAASYELPGSALSLGILHRDSAADAPTICSSFPGTCVVGLSMRDISLVRQTSHMYRRCQCSPYSLVDRGERRVPDTFLTSQYIIYTVMSERKSSYLCLACYVTSADCEVRWDEPQQAPDGSAGSLAG